MLRRRGSGKTQLIGLNTANSLVRNILLPLFRGERELAARIRADMREGTGKRAAASRHLLLSDNRIFEVLLGPCDKERLIDIYTTEPGELCIALVEAVYAGRQADVIKLGPLGRYAVLNIPQALLATCLGIEQRGELVPGGEALDIAVGVKGFDLFTEVMSGDKCVKSCCMIVL